MFTFPRFVVFALMVLIQGALFIGVQTAETGHPAFPLDDAYIHLQYAKQIALGNYFQYQAGEEPSSGATGFLYVHVLALGYLIGFRGEWFLGWVYLTAFLSLLLLLDQLYAIGERLGSRFIACGTLALVMSSGWLGWSFWSGMEIALFSALLAFTFHQILKGEDRSPTLWIGLMLTALCRPEGTLFLLVYLGMRCCIGLKRHRLISELHILPFIAYTGCFIGILLPPAVTVFTTGSPSANGLLAKWVFYHPLMTPHEQIGRFLENLWELTLFLCGASSLMNSLWDFMLPGTLLFAITGYLAWMWHRPYREAITLFFIPLCAAVFFIATIEVWHLHGFRYIAPFVPLFYLMALSGIEKITLPIFDQPRIWQGLLVLLCLTASLTFFPLWLMRYAEHGTIIATKQKRAAEWIHANLPEDARIAINDAGALAYYGERPVYDMVGLVTNANAIAYRMGDAGTYENLTALPQEKQPRYAAVFVSWFEEMAKIYDVFHQPLVTFPDLFNTGFDKTVFRINWNYYQQETQPRPYNVPTGWELSDWIDIAQLESENAHGYEAVVKSDSFPKVPVGLRRNFGYQNEIQALWPQVKDARPFLIPALRKQGLLYRYDILDGGRRIDQEERFYLRNLREGEEVHLVMRTCEDMGKHPQFLYRFILMVNNNYYDEIKVIGTPWNWTEVQMTIPGKWITSDTAFIRMINRGEDPFDYFMSFYYWAYQPPLARSTGDSLDKKTPAK